MSTFHVANLFFFIQRVLSGFNWFQVKPVGKLRKRRKRGCPEIFPWFEKSSDQAENFRVGQFWGGDHESAIGCFFLVFCVELRTYRQQQHLSLDKSSSFKNILHIIFSNAPPSPYILTYTYRRKANYPPHMYAEAAHLK